MKRYISYNKFVRNTILMSIFIVISLFVLYGTYIQSSSIQKSMKDDTKIMSDLVFQNLYTIMKNGGDKKLLDETINTLEDEIPNVNIRLIRDIDDSENQLVKSTFLSKKPDIIRQLDHLAFTTPIMYKSECLKCHSNGKIGEVAAVTIIEHPILDIKISLKEILLMASILFALIIIVFFIIWYYFLNKYFVSPIKTLVEQIDNNSDHNDLKNKIFIDTSIDEIKHLENAFNKQNKELLKSYKKLEDQSNTDALTGIYNRKKFDEYTEVFLNYAKRYENTFSLVVIDLNKFKPINDTYGHDIGDKVLIFFSKTISNLIREVDFFFRTGGDEFILILPNTKYQQAEEIVKKIKEELSNTSFKDGSLNLQIEASFGISQYLPEVNNITSMIKEADEKMYEDKKDNARK